MSVSEVFPPVPDNKSSAAIDGLKGDPNLSGLKINPTALYFGAMVVGEDPITYEATITNQGKKALRIESLELEQGFPWFSIAGVAPNILKGGQSFTIQVTYQSNAIGTFNGLITIRTSEKENNLYHLGLSGRVIGSSYLESITDGVKALVQEERWARTTADEAEAGHRLTLEASVNSGFSETNAKIVQEQIARATAFEAEATTREQLGATLSNQIVEVGASVEAERVARVNGQEALAARIEDLDAGFITIGDVETIAEAKVHEEAVARSTADDAMAGRISTIEADYTTNSDANQIADTVATAKVADEATARANAVQAVAGRVSAIEADYTTNAQANAHAVARVNEEAITRSNADGALAGRLNSIEADYTTGSQANAYAIARVAEEANVRAQADGALAGRASTLESQMNLGTDSSLYVRIRNEETARANAVAAVASRTSTLEARTTGGFPNRVANGDFAEGLKYWGVNGPWGVYESAWLGKYAGASVPVDQVLHIWQDFVCEAGNVMYASVEGLSDGAAYVQMQTINGPQIVYSEPIYLNNGNYNRRGNVVGLGIPNGSTTLRVSVYKPAGTGTYVNATRIAVQNDKWTNWRDDKSAIVLAARIAVEEQARVDATGALATRTTNLETRAGGAEARLTVTESVASDAYGRSRAFLKQEAVAGDGYAMISLWADSNGGGGVEIIGNVRIRGNLIVDGTINAASKVQDATLGTSKIIENSTSNVSYAQFGQFQLQVDEVNVDLGVTINTVGGAVKVEVTFDSLRSGNTTRKMRASVWRSYNGQETLISPYFQGASLSDTPPVCFFALDRPPAANMRYYIRFESYGSGSGTWTIGSIQICVTELRR